jgi:16S rRNA (cytosine1402-N4)-methyltransferase
MSGPDAPTGVATVHRPVLMAEVLTALEPRPGMHLVDGTLGGGGHAIELARRVTPGGMVWGLDRDLSAVTRVSRAVSPDLPLRCFHASYEFLPELLQGEQVPAVDGVLLDLGLSSDQLADDSRGFSFIADGPLDMRFDTSVGITAAQWLAQVSEHELARVIYEYGEERRSRQIARRVVEQRRRTPLSTVHQLAELIRAVVPVSRIHPIDPATRTFQAIRIAVNDELGGLERALLALPKCLRPGGRVVIISFHSLEDRIVKHRLRDDPSWDVLTRKPVIAGEDEVRTNRRARSAKLRVAQRRSDDQELKKLPGSATGNNGRW